MNQCKICKKTFNLKDTPVEGQVKCCCGTFAQNLRDYNENSYCAECCPNNYAANHPQKFLITIDGHISKGYMDQVLDNLLLRTRGIMIEEVKPYDA